MSMMKHTEMKKRGLHHYEYIMSWNKLVHCSECCDNSLRLESQEWFHGDSIGHNSFFYASLEEAQIAFFELWLKEKGE